MSTLKSLIPTDFSYSVSKVYTGIYSDYPLTKMNFGNIKDTCEALKSEIDNRYSLNSLTGASITFQQIDYVLSKIEQWISSGNIVENKDAEVFMDAFKTYFNELEEMLDEMDSGKVKR